MRHMKRRLMTLVLVLGLLTQMLTPAFAAVADTLGNTPEQNQSILEQLAALTGDESAAEVERILSNFGLLDENGELNLSQSVMLDGQKMKLAEVQALLNDSSTRLSRVATVDGTPISLGDLKTILQIEAELARIKATYFSGQSFSADALPNLQSLLSQIETSGIQMYGADTGAAVVGGSESVPVDTLANDHTARLQVDTSDVIFYIDAVETKDITVALNKAISNQGEFSWRVLDGSQSGVNTDQISCTAKLDGADPGTVQVSGSYSKTLKLQHYRIFNNEAYQADSAWQGEQVFYIQFYNPKNLLFNDGEQSATIRVILRTHETDEWAATSKTFSRAAETVDNLSTPTWFMMGTDDASRTASTKFLMTASFVAGDSPTCRLQTSLQFSDANPPLVDGFDEGYVLKGYMPIPYRQNGYNPVTYERLSYSDYRMGGDSADTFNPEATDQIRFMNKGTNHPFSMTTIGIPHKLQASGVTYLKDSGSSAATVTPGKLQTTVGATTVTLLDTVAPTVKSVTIPAGTYYPGDLVPITAVFSEPVSAKGVTLTANKKTLTSVESDATYAKRLTFVYQVGKVDDTTIIVSGVSNFSGIVVDDANKTALDNNGGKNWTPADVTLVSTRMQDAVNGISLSKTTVPAGEAKDGLTITLDANLDDAFVGKYASYNYVNKAAPFTVVLTKSNAASGEEPISIPMQVNEVDDAVSSISCVTGALTPGTSAQTYAVEVYAHENEADPAEKTLVFGKTAAFTVQPIIYAQGAAVRYPDTWSSGKDKVLTIGKDPYPQLGVTFTNTPTYSGGTWTSSDTDIATIDNDGKIMPTGLKVGDVTFTFTAANGGNTDPNGNAAVTSAAIKVEAGDGALLYVPAEANHIITKQGQPATVRWSSNIGLLGDSADFTYWIRLYEGNYADGAALPETPTATFMDIAKTNTSFSIDGTYLTALSSGKTPAYTAVVGTSNSALTGRAYVIVQPVPVSVHLTHTGESYMLDNQTSQINWTIDHYTSAEVTKGTFRIDRITTENGADVTTMVAEQPITAATGSYSFTPTPVTGLKDTYMVTLRAQNDTDAGWSTDSFPLYVYNNSSLQLEVNGQKTSALTMDNHEKVTGVLPTETSKIMALREELGLLDYIGINYGDYSWSQLKDVIKWATSDSSVVSVNYRQGSLYEDLSRFSMSAYLPETQMALSGLKNGQATITATHANTGMESRVTVDVKTLRDQFYLFQMTPMLTTELSYTDGKGTLKTVSTNSDGVLALYEPNGIASDVSLKATSGSDVYLGTIYQSNLVSGERDSTKLQLYPLNTFTLRQVAKADIYLKKADGTPYTGSVTLRGGVYKNGGYCQDARLGASAGALKDGKDDQTFTVGAGGKLTVYMDSTQFWSAQKGESNTGAAGTNLKATDSLQYIFELRTNDYLPQLIYANGNLSPKDIIRSAESVVGLTAADADNRNKPLLAAQYLDYGLSGDRLINVAGHTGHIGPNETYTSTRLQTTMLLWGEGNVQSNAYKLDMTDEFGGRPAAQSSEIITYPFSSMPVVRNTLTLSLDSITKSGWIPAGKAYGLRARLLSDDTMVRELPLPFKVVDLTTVPKMTDSSDVKNITKVLESNSGVPTASKDELSGAGDKMINGALQFLSMIGPVDGSKYKVIISPSEDNAVFKAFIWAGFNDLDLDDVDYSEDGVFVDTKLAEGDLSMGPSVGDTVDMAKGTYDTDIDKAQTDGEANRGTVSGSGEVNGQLEGYFEAEIRYNFTEAKWEMYVLGGGFTAGFGAAYTWNLNQMVGPVPVTLSLELGGAIQLDFKAAARYNQTAELEWDDSVTSQWVNDYLTTLRINAYVNAFGGVGFDYSLVALKLGLFGNIAVDNQNKFLSRTYLKDASKRQINGQALQLSGEVGIKAVAQLLCFSYELVIASVQSGYNWKFNDFDNIQNYWDSRGSGLYSLSGASGGMQVVHAQTTLESREYLDQYARSWGQPKTLRDRAASLFSLDQDNGLESLQSNAYPSTLPRITADGAHLLYVSDQNSSNVSDTRVYATQMSGGAYPEGSVVDDDGYGDSGLRLDGSQSFAAATWVRRMTNLNKLAAEAVTLDEQALMMNGTEVMAAVNSGSGWTTTRLSTNATPDLAPVVATNGSKAIIAWRSVSASDAENLTNFATQDNVLYRIYDGGDWSEEKILYNGTSGGVKGIEAAMLSDGTAAVAYVLDADSTDGETTDYEIAYNLVDTNGEPGVSMIATSDSYLDENPQIAAVKFADNDERFVLGWHSVHDDVSDVRLRAIDKAGLMSNSFIESISAVAGTSGVNIGSDFRFARMNGENNHLSNLSILWPETVTAEGETLESVSHSVLRAVKFSLDGSRNVLLSAPIDVAELPEQTLLEHFDAYVSDPAANEIKAVLQASLYHDIDPNDESTYTTYETDGGNVIVAKSETKLYTATETYENAIAITAIGVDYPNLAPNSLAPIQFTLYNGGMTAIDSAEVALGGETYVFDELDLLPNASRVLTCMHPTGNRIENADYTVKATFADGEQADHSGTVHLDYQDIGISAMQIVSENEGKRTVRMTLYNETRVPLADTGRTVVLDFSDDAIGASAVNITLPDGSTGSTMTISDNAALALIDEGAYTFEVTFDVGAYLAGKNLTEIPESGIRLYTSTRIEQASRARAAGSTVTVPEYNSTNNQSSVLVKSLLTQTGEAVTISTEQSVENGKTTALISVRNNTLAGHASGNLIVNLLDENGSVLETLQSYTGDSGTLISLSGEQTAVRTFHFTKTGARVVATFGDVVLDDSNAKLSALRFDGLGVRLSDFAEGADGNYTATVTNSTEASTTISFATEDPRASVSTTGGKSLVALAGKNQRIVVTVTAPDSVTQKSYTLLVNPGATGGGGGGVTTYTITALAGTGGTITPTGKVSVAQGASQTFKMTPDKGYAVADVLIDGKSVGAVSTYTFGQVTAAHTISVTFRADDQALPFTDVAAGDWFYEAVRFVYEKGLSGGTSETAFSPDATLTRAMLVVLLHRLEGSPAAQASSFTDVAAGTWYTDAVAWAAANNIVAGVADGRFDPDAPITREQLAVILYRYAQSKGYPVALNGVLDDFHDADRVSVWAHDALRWATGAGIVSGKNGGLLDPVGQATRAEVASMLMRFCQKVIPA